MSALLNNLASAFGRVFELLAKLAALILLGMVALITADILLRNAGSSGFSWANEVSEYTLYLITLMTAPWLLRRGQHVRLDLVLTLVPPPVAWFMEALGDCVGFAVCLVLVRYGTAMAYESYRLGAITIKNLVFPEWWLLAALPVCFALVAAEFVFRFHRLVKAERARRLEATSVS
jgi:TRAP-type transport system small permease protein